MKALLLIALIPMYAHASWTSKICSWLVAEPEYPLAEMSSDDLLSIYGISHNEDAFKELDFRAHAHMLTRDELDLFSVFIRSAAEKARRERDGDE